MSLATEVFRIVRARESAIEDEKQAAKRREETERQAVKDRIAYYAGWLGINGDYDPLPIQVEVLLQTVVSDAGGSRVVFPVRITWPNKSRSTLKIQIEETGAFNREGEFVWSGAKGIGIGGAPMFESTPEGALTRFAEYVAGMLIDIRAELKEPQELRELREAREGDRAKGGKGA